MNIAKLPELVRRRGTHPGARGQRLTSIASARPWSHDRLHRFAASGPLGRRRWLLPVEKRGIFLGRLIARLQLHGDNFTTADLEDAVRWALKGLIQKSAA